MASSPKRLVAIAAKEGPKAAIETLLKENPVLLKLFWVLLESTPGAKNFVALGVSDHNTGEAAFELIIHRAGGRLPSHKELRTVYNPGTIAPERKEVCDNCDNQNGCCMYGHAVDEGIDKNWGCHEWVGRHEWGEGED